jgi:pyocin large subunit-like protein
MRVMLFTAAGALALTLAACGQRQSAVPSADHQASSGTAGAYSSQASLGDQRDAPVPQVNGKPMWAANRTHSAEENAQYQFAKNGGDFGAATEADYVTKVHAFVERPPSGAETLDRRNGDRLIYDAKDNTFAVVSRAGAPRTMFKPRAGASYWNQQKERESQRSKSDSSGGGDQS